MHLALPVRSFTLKLMTLLLLLGSHVSRAAEISGRVVGLADGDTLTLLTATREQVRIRLGDIDAPESSQPYGARSQQILGHLVAGRVIRVITQDTDRYGRAVGRIYAGPVDVNAEMVRRGAAWVFRRYSQDPQILALEAEARASRRGLWALPESDRTPPWEWRAASRGEGASLGLPAVPQVAPVRPAAPPLVSPRSSAMPAASGGYTCGTKRYCREMSSCAEARFHLNQCGLQRLDGDGDGVPCETLCR